MGTFKVGITMAGAISAGAYSGGVLDFLMEALDEWQKAKDRQRDPTAGVPLTERVPDHDVVITVMTGASAGAMTGALALPALAEGRKPGTQQYPGVGGVSYTLPRLYKAWVTAPRFVAESGGYDLLGINDLGGNGVRSLLDCTVLNQIVRETFAGIQTIEAARSYIAEPLHLYMTQSNLRGVPYAIGFNAGSPDQPGYPMVYHADRVHYRISGLGSYTANPSAWAREDQGWDISVAKLANLSELTEDWDRYAQGALGSGAFPGGLSARVIRGMSRDAYDNRHWTFLRSEGGKTVYTLPTCLPKTEGPLNLDYVSVDGGVINNEPFEIARWALMETPGTPNTRAEDGTDGKIVDRAVLMIDPFPEPATFALQDALDQGLIGTLLKLLPMLKEQARCKPEEAIAAYDESIFSRFLIAPRRRTSENAEIEKYGIACGLLGGFGGFLAEEFRAHDYQLGRLNCYLFLKSHFALPENYRIVADGYAQVSDQRRAHYLIAPTPTENQPCLPLIPLVGSAAVAPTPPTWPRVSRAEVDLMVKRACKRTDKVVSALIKEPGRSAVVRWLVGLVWSTYGESQAEDLIRWSVLQDLIVRNQLEELKGILPETLQAMSADELKVIGCLADPSFDLRTVNGIAREIQLSDLFVSSTLARYAKLVWQGPRTKPGNYETYTLAERKPSWWSGIWGVKNVKNWLLGEPSTDVGSMKS